MLNQEDFEDCFEEELEMFGNEITKQFQDQSGEFSCCEHNFNNADPTSGMKCWESYEIDEMLKVFLNKVIGDIK